MDRIKLQKEFRQMVKDFDGEKAHNNVAGSVCEHYAIEFAIQQVKNCSIPIVSGSFTAEDMEDAYRDGYENDYPREWDFNIDNYR